MKDLNIRTVWFIHGEMNEKTMEAYKITKLRKK